ncbi:protein INAPERTURATE POLLEN1-like [Vigna umbellata]|uniref:protein INAPERTURATE POLLEN1-like n=1 Tax=Vigna umbellata TaxID=87088 RepID=UPI001F5E68A3|nr:protein INAPERTURATE POLLEN1-like [Vigna umbellata]
MDQIECRLRHIVATLSDRLKRAESAFMECIVGNWFWCWEEHNIAAAKEVGGADAKAQMEEVVSVVLWANRVRRSVLVDIMSATTVYQAMLFLEGLAQFLIGFRE